MRTLHVALLLLLCTASVTVALTSPDSGDVSPGVAAEQLMRYALNHHAICYVSNKYEGLSPYLGKPFEHSKVFFTSLAEALNSCGAEHMSSRVTLVVDDTKQFLIPNSFLAPKRVRDVEVIGAFNGATIVGNLGAGPHNFNITLRNIVFDFDHFGDCSMGLALNWEVRNCTFISRKPSQCEVMIAAHSNSSVVFTGVVFIGNSGVAKITDAMSPVAYKSY
jgi:hypothetical protein